MFKIIISEEFYNNEDAIQALEQIVEQLKNGAEGGTFPSWHSEDNAPEVEP